MSRKSKNNTIQILLYYFKVLKITIDNKDIILYNIFIIDLTILTQEDFKKFYKKIKREYKTLDNILKKLLRYLYKYLKAFYSKEVDILFL